MRRIAILGAGGHGKVVAEVAEASGWDSIVFFDDSDPVDQSPFPWPIMGDIAALMNYKDHIDQAFVGIGNNKIRFQKFDLLKKAGFRFATLIHPSSVVSERVNIGCGSVIMANAVINSSAQIGEGVIVNTAAVIEHDCKLGHFTHISPMAAFSGGVESGLRVWVGTGVSVIQNITIGHDSIVGAGSTVIRDVAPGTTVAGCPAKAIPSNLQ